MWDVIVFIFNTLVFEPIFNFLILVLNILPYSNLGVAIILTTIVVRIILYPSFKKSIKTQQKIAQLRPDLKKIEEKYKKQEDRQKRAQEQLSIYKKHGINPLSALSFPLLVQIPVLFGLYKVFIVDFASGGAKDHLYSFISYPESITTSFIGVDLLAPSIALAFLAAVSQYFQAKSMAKQHNIKKEKEKEENSNKKSKKDKNKKPEPDFQSSMNVSMMYVLPVIIFLFGTGIPAIGSFGGITGLPAGISLYWTVTTLFSFWQQQKLQKEKEAEEELLEKEKK